MKSASAGLDAHLQQTTTTLATCWKLTRTDGTKFHFTSHDAPLSIDLADGDGEQVYVADSSYNRSAIKNDDTLAVDNLDLTGVLTDASIKETELRRGLFDFAEVLLFIVNWSDLAQGVLRMRKGWLGEVTITRNGFFQAELRGLTQATSRNIGEVYSAECRADLGDTRCKVPITPDVVSRGTAYAVDDAVRSASDLDGFALPTLLVPADADADDISVNAAAATLGTQAAISTATKKFGAGSLELSPAGAVNPSQAFVSFPDLAAYSLGTGAFSIEGWFRFKTASSRIYMLASQYVNTGNQRAWYFAWRGDFATPEMQLNLYGSDGLTSIGTASSAPFTPVVGTWYHLRATRDGVGDVRWFIDGVASGSPASIPGAVKDSTSLLYIGKFRSAGFDDLPLDGFVDDFRLVVGAAVSVAGFTPPAAALPATVAAVVLGLTCPDYDDRLYVCTTAGTTGAVHPPYDADVGDPTTDGTAVFTAQEAWARCITVAAVDGADPRKKFTVAELTPNAGGTVTGRDQFPDDAMNGGLVVWEGGDNSGRAMEVRDFVADDGVTIEQDVELFLDMPFDIGVGDVGYIYRGCQKDLATCRDVFDAVVNRRAEDYIPGQDLLYNYPDAKS